MKPSTLAALLLASTVLGAFGAAAAGPAAANERHRHLRLAAAQSGDFGADIVVSPPPAVPAAPRAASGGPHTAAANDIVLVDGATTIRIKHVEIAGTTMSDADVAALFASKDPKALEARLHALDAASMMIPEITGDQTEGGTQSRFEQHQVLLADIHGGRASTGSAATTRATFKGDKGESSVTIGATTFKGLDLAQIVHLAAGPRTDDGEPLRPLADEMAMNAITITGAAKDGQPLSIATLREVGLKGRPLKAQAAGDAVGGQASADETAGGKTPGGSTAVDKDNAAALDDFVHSVSFDLLEADGIALAAQAGTATTEGLRSLTLKHVAIKGFGDGKLARFALNGLVAEGNDKQPGHMTVASAEIDGVASSGGPVPSIDTIDVADFAIDVPVSQTGQPESRAALAVASARYEAPGLVIGKLPKSATLSIAHATFDVPPGSGPAPVLLAMGYKHLDLSSDSASRYDAAAQTLALDRFALSGVGMGELQIKLDLAKVSEGIVSQNDAVQKAAAAAVRVKSVDLTLRNDGLIDKAIAFKAAIDGLSVEQERTNIAQLVDTGLVGLGLQSSDKAQRIVAALHTFIAAPKSLHLSLTSKTGLGADAMPLIDSPKTLLDAVEVEAGADQ